MPGSGGEHYQESAQGPFSAIGGLGVATHHLVVGDFTGDGRDDLLLQAVDPGGADGVALSGPHGGFRSLAGSFDGHALGLSWAELATSIVAGDFAGDGRADLLLRARGATGAQVCCDLVRLTRGGMPGRVIQAWAADFQGIDWSPVSHRVVVGDLTGDGRDDLLLQPVTPAGHVEVLLSTATGQIGRVVERWPALSDGVDWSAESYKLVADRETAPAGGGSVLLVPRAVGLPYLRAYFGPTGTLLRTEPVAAPRGPYGPGGPGSGAPGSGQPGSGGSPIGGGSAAGGGSFGRMGMGRSTSSATANATTSSSTPSSTPAVGTLPGHFTVSPTGAAIYRIPIAVAPGVNGLEPHLALVYQGDTGGSQLGLGWSLAGFSEIARCPDTVDADGFAASPTDAATDAYCLNGAHLIPYPGQTNGASGTNYHTTIAAFREITSSGGSSTTGPGSFTVLTKSGLTKTYGATSGSSVGDPPASKK